MGAIVLGSILALYLMGAVFCLARIDRMVGDPYDFPDWVAFTLFPIAVACVFLLNTPTMLVLLFRLRRVARHVRQGGWAPASRVTPTYINARTQRACREVHTDFGYFRVTAVPGGTCECGEPGVVKVATTPVCGTCLRARVAVALRDRNLREAS